MFRIALIVVSIAMAGCSSSPYSLDPNHSLAWNVTDAVGMEVEEIEREDLEEVSTIGPDGKLMRAAKSTAGLGGTMAVTSFAIASSSGVALANLATLSPHLAMFFLLEATESSNGEGRSQLIAWMPQSEAPNAEAAMELFLEIQKNAAQSLKAPYRLRDLSAIERVEQTFDPTYLKQQAEIDGGLCDDPRLSCAWIFIAVTPEPTTGPSWLGHKPSYLFFNGNNVIWQLGAQCYLTNFRELSWSERNELIPLVDRCTADLRLVEMEASKSLQDWVYVYRPEFSTDFRLPYLANGGEVYLFVEPE